MDCEIWPSFLIVPRERLYFNIAEVLDIQDQFAYYNLSITCHITQLHELCSHWSQEILQYHPKNRAKMLLLDRGN